MFACVTQKKNNNFETTAVIFKAQKKWKNTELPTKHPFFLYFRDRPKNYEENYQRRRRKYMRKNN